MILKTLQRAKLLQDGEGDATREICYCANTFFSKLVDACPPLLVCILILFLFFCLNFLFVMEHAVELALSVTRKAMETKKG
jgi:hypothetical protein